MQPQPAREGFPDRPLAQDESPPGTPLAAVIARQAGKTNGELVAAWRRLGLRVELMLPEAALGRLGPGDTALARLDVLPTLDGVEAGLDALAELELHGVRVLNRPHALLGAHDKLETVRRLARAGIPHPRTVLLGRNEQSAPLAPPLVLKPRFGSWGRDVMLCESDAELDRCLEEVRERPWFRGGTLLQELVSRGRYDLRLLVAGGEIVGAAERVAAPDEWRTNVSLGGSLCRVMPPPEACALGVAAAEAIGADLVGIDLLPVPSGGHIVLELNGAADFDVRYSLPDRDVFTDIARALALTGFESLAHRAVHRSTALTTA